MTPRTYLSEFEQLVMLAVLQLGAEPTGADIRRLLAETAGRPVSIATIYVALGRLETRGLVRSWMSDPVAVRGGRARRLFAVEPAGQRALEHARQTLERMWAGVEPGRARSQR